jgi:hypothetical protein
VSLGCRTDLHRAVVIAVLRAGVMKVTVHQIVEMVAVRNGRVPAARPVRVFGGVAAASVLGRADGGVRVVHVDGMGVDVLAPDVIEATVVKVVLVAPVTDGRVPAARSMRVKLALMALVIAHGSFFLVL